MKQFRSMRGSLASKVRESLFTFFGEDTLSRITTSASPADISNWKNLDQVKRCYKKLFDKKSIVLAKILEKVFGKNPKQAHIAFAIAICISILDPSIDQIQLSEESMREKYTYYLVSIVIFTYITLFIIYLFINIVYLLGKNSEWSSN